MDQVATITIARQAVKLAQLEELVELLKAELLKYQPTQEPEGEEEVTLGGDFDLDPTD